jgi:DNA-directed RNA polymerase specialized sigma24 family protein
MPFSEFKPDLMLTNYFMLRYFYGWDYLSIAKKYGKSRQHIRSEVYKAKKRVLDVLATVDTKKKKRREVFDKMLENSSGKLTRQAQFWILNKVCGVPPVEVAEYFGVHRSNVSGAVQNFSKIAGEIIPEFFLKGYQHKRSKVTRVRKAAVSH